MSKQVLVLGNHRSGSSCLAGVLHKLGVNMGDRMLGAHPSNPDGHYEDWDFLHLNDRVVGAWKNPLVYQVDDNPMYDLPALPPVYRKMYTALIELRNTKGLWGIKDPRLCITARYFRDLLDAPYIIEISRNREQIISSLMRRDGMSNDEAIGIVRTYTRELNETISEYLSDLRVEHLEIQFDDLCYNPNEVVLRIQNFLGEEFSPGAISQAVSHVNPSHRNF
jgi:hypothetical protein